MFGKLWDKKLWIEMFDILQTCCDKYWWPNLGDRDVQHHWLLYMCGMYRPSHNSTCLYSRKTGIESLIDDITVAIQTNSIPRNRQIKDVPNSENGCDPFSYIIHGCDPFSSSFNKEYQTRTTKILQIIRLVVIFSLFPTYCEVRSLPAGYVSEWW